MPYSGSCLYRKYNLINPITLKREEEKCEHHYQGPLCQSCETNFSKNLMTGTCEKCFSIALQILALILVCLLFICMNFYLAK